MKNWIKIEDKLPKIGECILVYYIAWRSWIQTKLPKEPKTIKE